MLSKNSNNEILNYELHDIKLFLKREDLMHPTISGNKFRKLKYNILHAKSENAHTLLTFGGAFSNHIEALSYAGIVHDFNTIGIIRGEELANQSLNPTLSRAKNNGMNLIFVTREEYKKRYQDDYLQNLSQKFDAFVIPEGGTNELAIKGCEEILTEEDKSFDYVCCPIGTGGTISGLINSSNNSQRVIGFSALKAESLSEEISRRSKKDNWELNSDYHFGGYAKVSRELIQFINEFKHRENISLDPVYTGKMMFGIIDLIQKGRFKKNTSILAIHTGGLQGIDGMNIRLKQKGLPIII